MLPSYGTIEGELFASVWVRAFWRQNVVDRNNLRQGVSVAFRLTTCES